MLCRMFGLFLDSLAKCRVALCKLLKVCDEVRCVLLGDGKQALEQSYLFLDIASVRTTVP